MPITAELHLKHLSAVLPLPHRHASGHSMPPTLTLRFTPPSGQMIPDVPPGRTSTAQTMDPLGVSWEMKPGADEMQTGVLDAAVREGVKGGWDVVDVLRRIEGSLRG
jgi:hypothetical protein